jgi:hypothetical protein
MGAQAALQQEHGSFVANVERMRLVADAVGEVPTAELRDRVSEAYESLTRLLVPHVMSEDERPRRAILWDRALTREHLEIARLLGELDALRLELVDPVPSRPQARALRRVLYGLYALMEVHVVGEDRCVCAHADQGPSEDRGSIGAYASVGSGRSSAGTSVPGRRGRPDAPPATPRT